jgi:hypothetical protein
LALRLLVVLAVTLGTVATVALGALVLFLALADLTSPVTPPAERRAHGCCPAPLTWDAAVAFPAAAGLACAVLAVLPLLLARGGTFARTGAWPPTGRLRRQLLTVAGVAAPAGVALATYDLVRSYGVLP